MPEFDPVKQRDFATDVVKRLQNAGYEAVWAGGCVRDELLGRAPKDYDVATDARPEQVRELFGRRRTLAIGAAFGVIVVLGPRGAGQIDVATFRQEADYTDGRRPDHVTFSSAELDAQRRDFTINGLFFDPIEQRVLDYVGGQDDLRRGVVRAIGDAAERISEDRLRMLRAVRFTAAYQFDMDPDTFAAVQANAADVLSVSAERIGEEIRRMLTHSTRADALVWLRRTGLLNVVLPEVAVLDDNSEEGGPRWCEALRTLAEIAGDGFPLILATLLYQNQSGISTTVAAVRDRLRLSNKETDSTAWLLEHIDDVAEAREMAWPQLQRLLTSEAIDDLLSLREAIASPSDAALVFCREKLALPPDVLDPRPLLTGDDLVAHGMAPGKHFQRLLEQVRDAQLEEKIATKEEALLLVDQLQENSE